MSLAGQVTVGGSWRAKMKLFMLVAQMAACLCGFAWATYGLGRTMHDVALRTARGKGEVVLLRDVLLRPVHGENESCILRAGTRIGDIFDGPDEDTVRVSVIDDTHRDGAGGCGRVVGEMPFADLRRYSDATNEVSPDGSVRHRRTNGSERVDTPRGTIGNNEPQAPRPAVKRS